MDHLTNMATAMMREWNSTMLVLIGLSVLCLLGLAVLLIMGWRLNRVNKEMKTLRRILEESVSEPEAAPLETAPSEPAPAPDFRVAVSEVETKKQLHEGIDGYLVPEKYGYAPSLLMRGLDPQEIADILQLSLEEVEQIADLTRIALKVEKQSIH